MLCSFYLRLYVVDALYCLQVLDVGLNRLLESNEFVLAKVLLQDLFSTSFRQNLAQIPAVVFEVFRDLTIGTSLAHGGKGVIPVERLGVGEDTFVLDVDIDESGDVQACGVLDIDEPFCAS